MIVDILSNKKLNLIVTELYIRGTKLNFISLLLDISTQYFGIKILNKRELQQIAFNHSSDIGFKGFMHIYEKHTAKRCIFGY